MTLKTSKNNSTILSRIGVGTFLVAALAATAPITFAEDGPKADAPKVKTQTKTEAKKVMVWVENNDGVETTKHIEVTVKDGVTTAYSVDEDGNKTEIDASEVEMMGGMDGMEGLEDMNVFVTDGMSGEKHIKIMKGKHMDGMPGDDMLHMKDGDHSKIIIKRMSNGEDGTVIDISNDVMVFAGEGNHAAAMVGAAQNLLDQAETMTGGKELSSKTRKKLAKARKALKEAQEALESEE